MPDTGFEGFTEKVQEKAGQFPLGAPRERHGLAAVPVHGHRVVVLAHHVHVVSVRAGDRPARAPTGEERDGPEPVGPGRGSAAGSLLSYAIGITDINPIRYGLLFERFLNPDRVSMPDIDIDFDDEGRQKVIDYVIDKYGRNQVAQIVTYGPDSVLEDLNSTNGIYVKGKRVKKHRLRDRDVFVIGEHELMYLKQGEA